MNNIYVLYCLATAVQSSHLLGCSNSIKKLQEIVMVDCFYVVNDPSQPNLKCQTKEGCYPYYWIAEAPYIC